MANQQKTKVYEFQFAHSPLKNQLHLAEIQSSESLYRALFTNLTPIFLEDIKWRMDNNKNFNILIEGEQGSGKSTIAREIKAYVDRYKNLNPSIADICFDRKEFLERFKTAKRFETIIIDEDKSYATQLGSMRVAEQFEFVEQAIRVEQTNIISCSIASTPHLFNYRLRAFDVDYNLGINRAVLYDNVSRWNSKPSGVLILPNSWLFPQIESDYNKKKEEFAKAVKQAKNRDIYGELAIKQKFILDKYGGQRKLKRAVITLLCRKEYPEISEGELGALNDMIWNEQDIRELTKVADELDKIAVKPVKKQTINKVNSNTSKKRIVIDSGTAIKAD